MGGGSSVFAKFGYQFLESSRFISLHKNQLRKMAKSGKKSATKVEAAHEVTLAEAEKKGLAGKKVSKAPKIQRLVTPLTLQRKRARISFKKKRIAKAKAEASEYQKLLATRLKEHRECHNESLAEKRSRLSAASKPLVVA